MVGKKLQSIFKQEEENDEDEGNDIKRANKQILGLDRMTETADVLDSSLYDYDGEYEKFKSQREAEITALHQSSARSSDNQSRYIDSLKASAKVREKEKERIFERKLLKEREKEDADFGDKPRFVTSAYKEKLKELEKWDYEDKLARELEKHQDVKSQGMQGFYANLLTKNVAMGNDVETNAISAYTAGSVRQKRLDDSNVDTLDSATPIEDLRSQTNQHTFSGEKGEDLVAAVDRNYPASSAEAEKKVEVSQTARGKEASQVSREDQIAAARARYLARKRSIHEVTDA